MVKLPVKSYLISIALGIGNAVANLFIFVCFFVSNVELNFAIVLYAFVTLAWLGRCYAYHPLLPLAGVMPGGLAIIVFNLFPEQSGKLVLAFMVGFIMQIPIFTRLNFRRKVEVSS